MKFSILSILTVLCLLVMSCEKDNSTQSLVNSKVSSDLSLVEYQQTANSGDNWNPNNQCSSSMNSVEQRAIRAAREANNAALAAHDAPKVAENYLESFFLLTSTNGFFAGKQRVTEIYQLVFTTRQAVLFVRTPDAITVNDAWSMASEKGHWVGTWIVNGENIRVAGDYYAKWHKVDGIWKLKCEVYTQLVCEGEVVCNNKPSLL